jgi:hypothetical protein
MRILIAAVLLAAAAAPGAVTAGPPVAAAPDATASSLPPPHALAPGIDARGLRHRPQVVEHYVDINSAKRQELMTLPGIGAAEADRIVAHRPYLTKTELVTKGALQTGPFLSLRHLVVAMPKSVPKGKP